MALPQKGVKNAIHRDLCTLAQQNLPIANFMGSFLLKGEPMSNEPTHNTVPSPAAEETETTSPDLVKKIGGTLFDIHIHFSEISEETFTDKVVRLIQNDKENKVD